MNYRHAYHAGGIADVFKHVVLLALLDRLKQKESAFLMLDTHAGTGSYDLAGIEAGKTEEFHYGVGRLHGAKLTSRLLLAYRAHVQSFNRDGGLRFFPGSPLLAARELRPHDRGVACELHDDDVLFLRRTLRPFANMAAHHRNGYEAMGAFLPPPEKRALVLIDPPYETPTELADAGKALRKMHARFPGGIYALWYPIKERPTLWRFHDEMIAATGTPHQIAIEFLTREESDSRLLNGSGMLIVNPPYRLEEALIPALEELRGILAPQGRVDASRLK